MSLLTVHLIDDIQLDGTTSGDVRGRLTTLLNDTLSRASKLGAGTGSITSANVVWDPDCSPGCALQDVVIRFVRSERSDKESYCRTTRAGDYAYETHGLTTFGGHGTRSVMYVPACPAGVTIPGAGQLLGNLAFHELMHNKLQLGSRLHTQPNVSLGAATVGFSTSLSDGDIQLLAPHLGDQHPQICTGGRHPQVCAPATSPP